MSPPDYTAYDNFGQPLPEPVLRKPGKRRQAPEAGFQITLKRTLTYGLASPGCCSRDGVTWFSIDAASIGTPKKLSSGKVINVEGIGKKMRGVVAGVPDVLVVHQGRAFWLELKAERGRLSASQIERHEALRRAGCEIAVVMDVPQVIAALNAWRVPHRIAAA